MRNNILETNPDAPIQVYAVWTSQLGATRADIDPNFFGDERVRTYWDPDGVTGEAVRDVIGFSGPVVWDVYALFGPDGRWDEHPSGFVGAGWPVIGDTDSLKHGIDELVNA